MRFRTLTMTVVALAAGGAQAQSTGVTLFGTVDVSGRYAKADGQRRSLIETTDALNSSQLGFRGYEDLGDGLGAGFTWLAGVNSDVGTTNSKFFNRRSTVSLFGKWGEIRLGRDYTPTFTVQAVYDAFGYLGLGLQANTRQLYAGTRTDNAVSYLLPPNLGGVYGQFTAAAAEGGGTLDRPARFLGGRLGYTYGPLDFQVAYGQERFVSAFGAWTNTPNIVPVTAAAAGDRQHTYNVGASWNFGFAKLYGVFDREVVHGHRENQGAITAVVPFGVSEVHFGYELGKLKRANGVSTALDQYSAMYIYNLSKRTALYTSASRLKNKDGTNFTFFPNTQLPTPGGKTLGADVGIRHFF